MERPEGVVLYGTTQAPDDAVALTAGPVTLRLQGTRLAALCVAGHEVWHGVAFLYRDAGWGTPEPRVLRCTHRVEGEGFVVDIEALIDAGEGIDLQLHIEGSADGRLRYEAAATPRADLLTQRMGLCVMHPMSAMARPVEVAHDDGRTSRSTLPELVPPWPPFTLVRGVRHAYADDAWAGCRLAGGSFEFEDQRNNADASFKTYFRPNAMPRPYLLRAGVTVRQGAELWIEDHPAPAPASASQVPRVVPDDASAEGVAPRLTVGVAPEDLARRVLLPAHVQALAPIGLHLMLDTPGDTLDLRALRVAVAASRAPFRLDIRQAEADTPAGAAALEDLASRLHAAGTPPAAVAAFPATLPMVALLRRCFPGAAIGGGTPHFFAQINRLEDAGPVDFLSFTTSAIVHGADDESPMHGLQSLPWLVRTLQARHPGLPVRVGPSGIAAVRSPLGPQPASDGTRRIALARRDPRAGALYGAAWILGHVAGWVAAGVNDIGLHGLGEHEGLFVRSDVAPDDAAALAPAGAVLALLARASGLRCAQGLGRHIAGLWLRSHEGPPRLLVANLGPEPQMLRDAGGHDWAVMDAKALRAAPRAAWRPQPLEASDQLPLAAYAVAHSMPRRTRPTGEGATVLRTGMH
ncbi:MAG: hypothetical protein J7603_04250 [Pseudacidovorax sp.]|nr:hypothetical protein [Pseudacidovorax sp.]